MLATRVFRRSRDSSSRARPASASSSRRTSAAVSCAGRRRVCEAWASQDADAACTGCVNRRNVSRPLSHFTPPHPGPSQQPSTHLLQGLHKRQHLGLAGIQGVRQLSAHLVLNVLRRV